MCAELEKMLENLNENLWKIKKNFSYIALLQTQETMRSFKKCQKEFQKIKKKVYKFGENVSKFIE